ncbi:hypothetical protein [Actinomadura harenae]|uniref:Uncharacterized protein n=1 Tax=Actinomadura harenae TaxID=2483351 RepID=A0A3M2LU58_9ACTN|nr:hypothetical protein [Actinomadura harenae]RMI41009.1 hypothetical protein EBO15_24705 [Actinomadura harenae]
MADTRRPEWTADCCVICPAQKLGVGEFDVADRPGARYTFDRERGYRVDTVTGHPVCVHPFRVGLEPGPYASAADGWPDPAELPPDPLDPAHARRPAGAPRGVFVPAPEQLELPESVDDLEGWLVAMLRTAPDDAMASALDQAETIAGERFSGEQIVTALRRVLATELRR